MLGEEGLDFEVKAMRLLSCIMLSNQNHCLRQILYNCTLQRVALVIFPTVSVNGKNNISFPNIERFILVLRE